MTWPQWTVSGSLHFFGGTLLTGPRSRNNAIALDSSNNSECTLRRAYSLARRRRTVVLVRSQGVPADLDQRRTPLVDAVQRRGDALHEAPFHVPGHKRGARPSEGLDRLVRPPRGSVLQYDLTEIAGLDFLSSPTGVIQEAQQLAAAAFGAERTWFLVNGCSVGIHAAVVAATAVAGAPHAPTPPSLEAPGEEVSLAVEACGGGSKGTVTLVVARNCHLSAFSAMVVAGCEPYWLLPEIDPRFGVAHCVTPGSVRVALEDAARQGRRVVGVMIVSPTYYGAVADVEGIAAVCHEHDVPLLVDEAHGGHFAFLPAAAAAGPSLPPPPSALRCGADMVMQSTHKVLGAMTQAAILHMQGPRVCPARIGRALQTLQSSSPSYLLMASLDAARAQAAAGGAFEEATAAAQLIRDAVEQQCRTIRLLDERTAGSRQSVLCFDPLRLTLLVDGLGLPGGGFEAAEWLEARHGVVPELATAKTVVLALGPGSTLQHARTAAAAILDLEREAASRAVRAPGANAGGENGPNRGTGGAPAARRDLAASSCGTPEAGCPSGAMESVEVVMTPRAAFFAPVVSLPADEAVGRVSAELLCPYPPGVPLLFPGERITAAALAALRATLAAGGAVTGASDPSLTTLVVTA